jgi:lysylphosphatidylglycerol synthetase-like protein (DUF2156 family)
MESNEAPTISQEIDDGIRYIRLFRWQVSARYLFLAMTVLEFFELETFAFGSLHHLFDAIVLTIYGILLRVMGCSWRTLVLYCSVTVVAWGLDVANIRVEFVDLESLFWLLTHLLLAVILSFTLKRRTRVTEADLAGAIAFYLMVGIVFANIYNVILGYDPHALISSHTAKIGFDQILYYSFMTQLTVGYGDIVPGSPLMRVVCVLQAIFGVMYIAILISWLVSAYIASHPRN